MHFSSNTVNNSEDNNTLITYQFFMELEEIIDFMGFIVSAIVLF